MDQSFLFTVISVENSFVNLSTSNSLYAKIQGINELNKCKCVRL